MKYTQVEYYKAINPLTLNWCLSKTPKFAWSYPVNQLVFDSGWTNISIANDAIKEYIKNKESEGILIRLLND